jgi:23S rRNA (uracil1939-C5)-methyltransferase
VGRTPEGFTVFVPDGLPGDRVRAKVISVKAGYGRALMETVLSPAADRVEPLCPHHATCGGCQLQTMSYPGQLKLKQKFVKDAVERIGGLERVTVKPVLGMENPWNYRNKAQFPVGAHGGEITAGIYEMRTHRLVDIDQCPIQEGPNNTVLEAVKKLLTKRRIPAYDEDTRRGVVRHLLVKYAAATGEIMLVLVTNTLDFPGRGAIAKELMANIPGLVSVMQNVNTRATSVILGPRTELLGGRPYIVDEIRGVKFQISATSFYQVNPSQTGVLYEEVRRLACAKPVKTVVDAYCGIGTISLFLAPHVGQVIGVEVIESAVRDARRNAKLNGVTNAEFYPAEAERWLPEAVREGLRPDLVVVDPPRAGCDPRFLEAVARANVPRIVMVSCNPATMARDLKYLVGLGYKPPESIQPVDMFPHTVHVEAVALMSKAKV